MKLNPFPIQAGKGYKVGESVIFHDEVTGRYIPARISRVAKEGRQVYYILSIPNLQQYGRIAYPSQLRRSRPGGRDMQNPKKGKWFTLVFKNGDHAYYFEKNKSMVMSKFHKENKEGLYPSNFASIHETTETEMMKSPIIFRKYARQKGFWSPAKRRMGYQNPGDEFVIRPNRLGHLTITKKGASGSIYLQSAADIDMIGEVLTNTEQEKLANGWAVTLHGTHPRMSFMDEIWAAAASNPNKNWHESRRLTLLSARKRTPIKALQRTLKDKADEEEIALSQYHKNPGGVSMARRHRRHNPGTALSTVTKKKIFGIPMLAALAVGGFALWYFVIRKRV